VTAAGALNLLPRRTGGEAKNIKFRTRFAVRANEIFLLSRDGQTSPW